MPPLTQMGPPASSWGFSITLIDGLSHSPQEAINWDDLEKGANLLLHSLIRLAQ